MLWSPANSETAGDPFFAVASTPLTPEGGGDPNPLYDPNYRQLDVEGYRVYRGRVDSPNSLALVAQFDYAGTVINDFTGQVNPTPGCAPEIGIRHQRRPAPVGIVACPVDFDSLVPGVAPTVSNASAAGRPDHPGQARRAHGAGHRRGHQSQGGYAITGAGNAAAGAAACASTPACRSRSWTDGVRSNLRYFYSVVAFDMNSFQSGPSSIESPRSTKPIIPVGRGRNFTNSATS